MTQDALVSRGDGPVVTVTISGPKEEANDVLQRLCRAYGVRQVEIVAIADASQGNGPDGQWNRVACLSVRPA